MTRARKPRSEADVREAVAAVIAGLSYRNAERMSGIPLSTLRAYVVQRGLVRVSIPRRGPKGVDDAALSRALEAVAGGASHRAAAKLAGIGVSTVGLYVRGKRGPMPSERKRRAG